MSTLRVLPDDAIDHTVNYSKSCRKIMSVLKRVANATCRRFEQWSSHPHSKMNQLPSNGSVRGDFSGYVRDLGRGTVTFSWRATTFP